MMRPQNYFQHIRHLIAKDDTAQAIHQLCALLENSPQLTEVLIQSSRHASLIKQIRMGLVEMEQADRTKQQINKALLDLLAELSELEKKPSTQAEMQQAIALIQSKNILIHSNIQADGEVHIGDRTIHTETATSRKLRLFSYILLPVLAIGAAYFWYAHQFLQRPASLKVRIENKSASPYLAGPNGTLVLSYGRKSDTISAVSQAALFEEIPAHYQGEPLRLVYKADGFLPVDTNFIYHQKNFLLPVYRNEDLAIIQGTITEEDETIPIPAVKVTLPCCSTTTDSAGAFTLKIPFKHQRPNQRLSLFKTGYKKKELKTPVIRDEPCRTYLIQNNN